MALKKKTPVAGKIRKNPSQGTQASNKTNKQQPSDGTSAQGLSLPTVPHEKILENLSEVYFKEVVHPWLVTNWKEHDYGIDGIVEIARERPGNKDRDATGKRFAVQLKATEAAEAGVFRVRVKPESINYWLNSTEPTVLVICHTPTRQMVYAWIDDAFIANLSERSPDWRIQDSVTLVIPASSRLNKETIPELERHVYKTHRQQSRLTQGQYFNLQDRATQATRMLREQAAKAGFGSVTQRLNRLEEKLRAATYVVAITGKSRAGKSTLLNVFVGRDVSPVGKLPTTAVSMLILAGAKNEAEVVFRDGKTIEGPASATFLADYATQEKNPDNQKGVRHVTVRLIDESLNQGVVFVDAPGLHDASEDIRDVTEKALKNVHLVLYVIDVSAHRDGGFSIDKHTIDDLRGLSTRAEHLMLVLSKADALTAEERAEVQRYIENELKKYQILVERMEPPTFICAREAWAQRDNRDKRAEALSHLDQKLWNYLLSTNSTGIHRLAGATQEISIASEEFITLMSARQHGGRLSAELQDSIKNCEMRSQELLGKIAAKAKANNSRLAQLVNQSYSTVSHELRTYLEGLPKNTALPKPEQIVNWLRPLAANHMHAITTDAVDHFNNLAAYANSEIEKLLKQVRLSSALAQGKVGSVDLSNFELTETQVEAWGGMFLGSILGIILGPAWFAGLAAFGYLMGHLFGEEAYRKRQINKIIEKSNEATHRAFSKFFEETQRRMNDHHHRLTMQVEDRVRVFIFDVRQQIERAGKPLSQQEVHALEQVKGDVFRHLELLKGVLRELGSDVSASLKK